MSDDVQAEADAFRQEVRRFCAERLPPALVHKVRNNLMLEKEDYLSYLHALQAQGWIVGHWPREHGGCEWTPLRRFIFEEETTLAGAPWLTPFGINYVGPIIYTYGTQAQKDRFLPPIRASQEWWAQGYSEPDAGSDLASLRTRAVRDGDHYLVSGQKIWTTYAQWADWIFCLVRTSQEDRPQKGISFLLIDMKTPGITVRPIGTMDGYHHLNEVFFDEVRVPVANIVGREGDGWGYGKVLLANERVLVAELGRSTRQFMLLHRLANEQQRGGTALAQDACFARRLAELKLRLHVLRATCYQAVTEAMAGSPPGAEASLMKIRGSELRQDIAETLVDVLGNAGMTFDPSLARGAGQMPPIGPFESTGLVRDHLHGRATTIYGGSNEVQRNIIAKAALGL
jgi:alkylation response protein AidB-like acyl-CoA dehydrogenase